MSVGLELPKIPTKLVITPHLSDVEFEQLCAANADVPLERTKEGEIVVNAPAGFDSSSANAEITYQLRAGGRSTAEEESPAQALERSFRTGYLSIQMLPMSPKNS